MTFKEHIELTVLTLLALVIITTWMAILTYSIGQLLMRFWFHEREEYVKRISMLGYVEPSTETLNVH
jgi:antibiotic biosynthesis monooxygenase (ABM) superfamily enzyme